MLKRFMVVGALGMLSCLLAVAPPLLVAQEGKVVIGQARNAASAEEAIREALGKQCQLEFVEQPLKEVVEKIQDAYEIGVKLDERALDAVGIGGDTPITINVKNVSLKSALALVLNDLELTWMIRHEVLLVTTREEAEQHLTTRVFEVRDLVLSNDVPKRPIVFDGLGGDADFDSLIETITTIVHPETWDEVGGPGSISPIKFSGKYALVVSQTEQVHEQIEELLASLRKLKKVPVADEPDKGAAVEKKDDAFVRVYPVAQQARALPEDLAELVKSALDDEKWDEGEGTFVRGVAETVIVKHNPRVQKRVRDLLQGIGAVESVYGFGGGLGGGGFGGNAGGFGGAGIQGGGFF